MSLIPHGLFSRSMFDMDQWQRPFGYLGQSTLDLFDPFDEFDYMMGKNFEWLNKPGYLTQTQQQMLPKFPQKYRVMVDCAGYDPKSIKTEVSGRKLFIHGREEHKGTPEDYSTKEFKKTYDLPAHAETDKLVSFMTPFGTLVVEVPLKETTGHPHSDLYPKIVEQNGHKMVQMQFGIPENIDPSKVHVSIKDRDLICKAEDKVDRPDGVSRFYYYKRATLPENTDFEQLKCSYEKGRLSVHAPIRTDFRAMKHIPITYKGPQPYYGGYPYGYQYGMQYGPQYYGTQYGGQQPYYGQQQYGQK